MLATPPHKLINYLTDSTHIVSQDTDGGVVAWNTSRLREELRALGPDWEHGMESRP